MHTIKFITQDNNILNDYFIYNDYFQTPAIFSPQYSQFPSFI